MRRVSWSTRANLVNHTDGGHSSYIAGADALAVLCAHGAPGARKRLLTWTLGVSARERDAKLSFVSFIETLYKESVSLYGVAPGAKKLASGLARMPVRHMVGGRTFIHSRVEL